jgi:O-acetyl-ADP-ribose deacetylase (regulator of RNase III)
MIKVISDSNIFDSNCSILVNPVNCVGVMGAGLAKQFSIKFPGLLTSHKNYCDLGIIKPGILHFFKVDSYLRILNFPTKNHWKNPSELEYVEKGLDKLVECYQHKRVSSIAFPMLGSGLGGLDRSLVLSLMLERLEQIEQEVEIEIYN